MNIKDGASLYHQCYLLRETIVYAQLDPHIDGNAMANIYWASFSLSEHTNVYVEVFDVSIGIYRLNCQYKVS